MYLTVSAWGNSLGLRIPKSIVELLGIKGGSQLKAKLEAGRLILSPIQDKVSLVSMAQGIDLKKMVSRVTAQNKPVAEEEHPAGNEVW